MARIRRQKLTTRDTPEAMVSKLNELANDVVNATTKSLSLSENLYGDLKEIDYISTALPVMMSWSFPRPPAGLIVLGASQVGSTGESLSGGVVTWSYNSAGNISVSNIAGLTSGVLYRVKIAILAG